MSLSRRESVCECVPVCVYMCVCVCVYVCLITPYLMLSVREIYALPVYNLWETEGSRLRNCFSEEKEKKGKMEEARAGKE